MTLAVARALLSHGGRNRLQFFALIFGVALGVLIFGETMDTATWVGSALIVTSGLFILWRGRAVTKA